jgi:hypothetical protein
MASIYRTARKRISDSLVAKLNEIDGNHPFNSNMFLNAHSGLTFLDDIQEYPKVCVIAGDETRQYQPNEFKWRFLSLSIRVYVEDQDDPQEVLTQMMEDIERVIDENDVLTYDDTVSPNLTTTSLTLQSLSTDEGVLKPLGVGEMILECRY